MENDIQWLITYIMNVVINLQNVCEWQLPVPKSVFLFYISALKKPGISSKLNIRQAYFKASQMLDT